MDYSILSPPDTAVYVGCWDPCPDKESTKSFSVIDLEMMKVRFFLLDLELNEAFKNRNIVSCRHSLIQVQL